MSADDTLAFLAVAQCGGFSAAAAHLKQPKSTLVRRVRVLETSLGVRLFDRTTRSLSLTEAGHVYRDRLGDWGRILDEAGQAVTELRGQASGWIRISLPHSLVGFVTPCLAQFGENHPDIRFDLMLDHRPADLISDDLDIALRLGPLGDSTLVARSLTKLPNRIYAAPAYLGRHGEPQHPDDLKQHRTLANRMAQRQGGHAWGLSSGGALRDFSIEPAMVADDPTALLGPLEAGVGLMLATDLVVAALKADRRIVPVMPDWMGRSPELHALFPAGRAQLLKMRLLVDFLASSFASTNCRP